MRISQRITMIAKTVFVAFCVFQVAFGQNPEQELRELITQSNEDMNEYVNPLVQRMISFGNSFGDEARRLETEKAELREELQNLAIQISNGNDVSICLDIALEDADRIFQDRENELSAFHTVEFNSFNYVFNDLSLVGTELENLVRETEDSIQTCSALATTEEVNDCNSAIVPTFDAMKTDILRRIAELYELGQEALRNSEQNQESFNDGNRQFVRESSQVTRDELTRCVQNM